MHKWPWAQKNIAVRYVQSHRVCRSLKHEEQQTVKPVTNIDLKKNNFDSKFLPNWRTSQGEMFSKTTKQTEVFDRVDGKCISVA
jgi:hypothetical protein